MTLPEFEITIETVRSGTRILHVSAVDAVAARLLAESACEAGDGHCPPEWCIDDVQSAVVRVRPAAVGG